MEQLLLKRDGAGRNDDFLMRSLRVEKGGDEIGERLADPGRRFDDMVLAMT